MSSYQFRVLRYVPTISGEFYNLAIVLYDDANRIVDARFVREFDRLRCNPAVEMRMLEALRAEFEEQRLLGEGFHAYFDFLTRNLSDSLQITDFKPLEGGEAVKELDRLVAAYLTIPPELAKGAPGTVLAGRTKVRIAMSDAFERHGILRPGLLSERIDVAYGGPRLTFRFDFSYEASGNRKFLHALGSRSALHEATRLGFIMERLRGDQGKPPTLTTVYEAGIAQEALDILELSQVRRVPVGTVDKLAENIRDELGL